MADRIVVLGMHRSGTSVVTRVINLLGVPLAIEDDLHTEGWDNPGGHWESKTLIEWNDRILAAFGGTWYRPPKLPRGWENSDTAERVAAQASEAFHGVHPTPSWACKDPRLCLTLPFWRSIIQPTAIVLVVRNPGPIAYSIYRRDHYRLRVGASLWETYLRSALRSSVDLPFVKVVYEDLVGDPAGGVGRLSDALAGLGIEPSSDAGPAVASIGTSRVDRQPNVPLTRWQRRLAQQLGELPDFAPSLPMLDLGAATPGLRWTYRLPDRLFYRGPGSTDDLP